MRNPKFFWLVTETQGCYAAVGCRVNLSVLAPTNSLRLSAGKPVRNQGLFLVRKSLQCTDNGACCNELQYKCCMPLPRPI